MNEINSIVIIGGGSAGWMTASTLIKFFPEKKITLIESEKIGRIGVGESTLPSLLAWCHYLGIDHKDFMKDTDASYKLSISFKNFNQLGDNKFHYPFGIPNLENFILPGGNDWHINKIMGKENIDYIDSMYPQSYLIKNNKISDKKVKNFDLLKTSALHFDAMKFADWLMNKYAIPRGVKRIVGEVVDINTNENGIKNILISDSTHIDADLYIDCSGFRSILLGGAMKEKFLDYSDRLPVNSAWAVQLPYDNKDEEMKNYTECTALTSGWVWNAPLYSRIGTGYVYSDKFISDDEALLEFKEFLKKEKGTERITEQLRFNNVKFRTGIYERTWVNNVLAIGLSGSFVEPLESNGLFFVHENLLKLVQILSRGVVTSFDRSVYNLFTKSAYDSFANFIRLHYFLSKRNDSEFWKYMTNLSFDNLNLNPENELFEVSLNIFSKNSWDVSGENGYHAILTGHNVSPISEVYIEMVKHYLDLDIESLCNLFTDKSLKFILECQSEFKNSLSHYDYLTENFHGGIND